MNGDVFLSTPRVIKFSEAHQDKQVIYDIEIFAAGSYRGITFTPEDIQQIAQNFHLLKEKVGLDVPLKVDHTDEAEAVIGWIIDVKAKGDVLYADAEITEPIAFEKIVRGTWKKVSCEIYLDFVDDEGKPWGKALRAVAIVAHPQVKKIRGFEVARFFESLKTNTEVMIVSIKDAISTAFGWLSQRFKSLAEEAEFMSLSAVRHSLSYDKAPEDTPWDANAAIGRLSKWASSDGSGEKETIDWAKFREGFAWYDPENADNFYAYKLPHHDIVDGRFCVVWRGVVAAMAALKGARGGVDIPEADRRAVYNHLKAHYEEFNREAPEFEEKEEGGEFNLIEFKKTLLELEEAKKEIEALKAELQKKEEMIKALEEEKRKREEEEKRKGIEMTLKELVEKGSITPAEKEKWENVLLTLGDEEREKVLEVLRNQKKVDFEEKSKTLPPEEETAKMEEKIAERMVSYLSRYQSQTETK